MAKNIPWNSRLTWYLMNDPQIMDYTDEDFEKEAKVLHDIGITAVMMNNKVHFRWNYYPYWDLINSVLARIVKAFHKYDIKVIEHHSASLCHCPVLTEEGEVLPERWERGDPHDKRVKAFWSKAYDFVTEDSEIDGVKVRSMMQIDGSTGKIGISNYKTHTFCYNNEDYRRIYLKYLESVYATGVDGIMNDDIQYFNNGNACACPACRKLFKEQTGYSLPETPEEWNNNFFGDYTNPAFVAFNKFKHDSTARWQRDIQEHFKSLGLNMLRPNYISGEVMSNYTFYPFDNVSELWDAMFQENCSSYITKYSYPHYYVEAAHRYAFASHNGIPSMSMFYDNFPAEMYFSWSMAFSWGQLYNPSFKRTEEMTAMEKLLRGNEKKYTRYFYDQQKKCDFAVFFSMKTRDQVANAGQRAMRTIFSWLQTAEFTSKTTDFVIESAMDDLEKYPMIFLPHSYMMTEEEIKRFSDYARNGGKLVICGLSGLNRTDGSERSLDDISNLFGYKTKVKKLDEAVVSEVSLSSGKTAPVSCSLTYEGAVALGEASCGTVAAKEAFGKGEIIFIGVDIEKLPFRYPQVINRADINDPVPSYPYTIDALKATAGVILDALIEDPIVCIDSDKYQVTFFDSLDKASSMCHLVNITNTLKLSQGEPSLRSDSIPNFEIGGKDAVKNDALTLKIAYEKAPSSVKLFTPEAEDLIALDFIYEDGKAIVKVPAGIFSGYGLVVLDR